MTKDELILNLLETVKDWLKDAERAGNNRSWHADSYNRLCELKQYKKADQEKFAAKVAQHAAIGTRLRFCSIAQILKGDGLFAGIPVYEIGFEEVEKAIEDYRDRVKQEKEQ